MFASSAILHLTHNDLYGRGVDSTLTKLGLRTTVHFGDRQNRSLIPLDEFARADSCCLQECAFTIGIVGLRRQWAPYERASNERDQDIAVVNVLWNAPFARETPWCNEFIGKMFGIGDSRIARLRAVVSKIVDQTSAYSRNHGNTGRTPVNATPPDIVRVYTRLIEENTRTDPTTKKLHLVADSELRGAAALVHKLKKGAPTVITELHDSTLRRFIQRHLKKIGCSCLCVHLPGHNVCADCKESDELVMTKNRTMVEQRHRLEDATEKFAQFSSAIVPSSEQATHASQQNALEAQMKLADLAYQVALRELEKATEAGAEHLGNSTEIAAYTTKIVGIAQAFEADWALACQEAARAGLAETRPAEPRSLRRMSLVCFDDKSALELPHTPRSQTEVLPKASHAVNAQSNMVQEDANIFVCDSSSSGKNVDHVLNECALNIAMFGTGARILFLLSDMGPLNHNLAMTVLFGLFLTTLGLFDMVITTLLQRLHSKQICDRM